MVRLFRQRRLLLLLCLGMIICVLLITIPFKSNSVMRNFYYLIYPEESIACYRLDADTLPDINDAKPPPRKGRSIFFHETSCSSFLAGKVRNNNKTNQQHTNCELSVSFVLENNNCIYYSDCFLFVCLFVCFVLHVFTKNEKKSTTHQLSVSFILLLIHQVYFCFYSCIFFNVFTIVFCFFNLTVLLLLH